MNKTRERKLLARERRRESFESRYGTTAISLPQPTVLIPQVDVIKVEKPAITKNKIVEVLQKRGRGRPPKNVLGNKPIMAIKTNAGNKKKVK